MTVSRRFTRSLAFLAVVTLPNAPLAAAQAAQSAPTTAPAQPQTEQAQAKQSLTRFLGALAGNPELLAAQAGLEAAELQLRAARDPVSLEATGGYSRFALDDALTGLNPAQITGPTDPGADPGAAPGAGDLGTAISETGYKLGATLVFRPFPFGDTADLLTQRQVELQTSQLDLENARAGLEARALVAALQARLAERSVKLSQEGVTAATQGLEAARLRVRKGAANRRDLRDAEAALLSARTALSNAQLDIQSARLNLQSLVGNVPAPSYGALASLTLPTPHTPLSVAQTRLQTQLAALQISAAQREILPVASASYAWNVSDYSTVTASLESRTLQPSVGFSYQDPGRTLPQSAVRGSLQLGISATISVGALDALNAVKRQEAAAQASLQAAQQGGNLQETTLRAAYTKAQRNAELDRLTFQNARTTYQENVTRLKLGLSTPLETQTSLLDLLQADLQRRNSELTTLSALLDLYQLYALPLRRPYNEAPLFIYPDAADALSRQRLRAHLDANVGARLNPEQRGKRANRT